MLSRGCSWQGQWSWRDNVEKAKAAYSHFLTLWNHADPDIPILQKAKAELAKLS